MAGWLDTLRDGGWLTLGRLRLWALAVLVASAAGLVYLVATSDGLNDYQGRPLGTDFSNIYVAGTQILEGRPEAPFDPQRQFARAKHMFGPDTPFYGWHYPPLFHPVAAMLALLPYQLALVLWQAATLLLYLLAIRAIVATTSRPGLTRPSTSYLPAPEGVDARDRPGHDGVLWLLLAVAFPAVFVNLGHGHNGFLTAALFGFALVNLDRRPVVGGALFGLLAYKPQFGPMIPLVLAATGRWRTMLAAAATVAALAFAVTLAFGIETWRAFFHSAGFTRLVLEEGGPGWHMIQSVFSAVRMWGGPILLAYAVQGIVTLGIAVALVSLWRSRAAFALKAAALCIATLLATPYCLDYDMMLLAPAIAFLAVDGTQRGFSPYHKTALAALWLVPLVARSVAQATLVPLGAIAMLALLVLVMRRARRDLGAVPNGQEAILGS
jgi:alpha-1,2-mannosyltransferase